jgi:F0F1-type ATP synthase beta subunit
MSLLGQRFFSFLKINVQRARQLKIVIDQEFFFAAEFGGQVQQL